MNIDLIPLIILSVIVLSASVRITLAIKNRRDNRRRLNAKYVVYYTEDKGNDRGAFCIEKEYDFLLSCREDVLKRFHRHRLENGDRDPYYDSELSLSLIKPREQCVLDLETFRNWVKAFARRGVLLKPVQFEIYTVGDGTSVVEMRSFEQSLLMGNVADK